MRAAASLLFCHSAHFAPQEETYWQLEGADLDRVALHVAGNIGAEVIFLVGRLQRFDDFLVAVRVELEEFLV